jgi:hypothetical protein
MSKSMDEMMAEFTAKGKKVAKLETGVSSGRTASDWRAAIRGEETEAALRAKDRERQAEHDAQLSFEERILQGYRDRMIDYK